MAVGRIFNRSISQRVKIVLRKRIYMIKHNNYKKVIPNLNHTVKSHFGLVPLTYNKTIL